MYIWLKINQNFLLKCRNEVTDKFKNIKILLGIMIWSKNKFKKYIKNDFKSKESMAIKEKQWKTETKVP